MTRMNNLEIKIYYNEKFICSHPRSYLKNKIFTTEGHREGLIARKPEVLGGGLEGGSAENEGPGEGNNLEVPESLDCQGESRSQNADDLKQDQDGKVP